MALVVDMDLMWICYIFPQDVLAAITLLGFWGVRAGARCEPGPHLCSVSITALVEWLGLELGSKLLEQRSWMFNLHWLHSFLPPSTSTLTPEWNSAGARRVCTASQHASLCRLWLSSHRLMFRVAFFLHLYWSIIALQWCVSFCFITKWIRYTYTYIPISPPSCVSFSL